MTNILLPYDVVMDILSRLPVKSLLRFRCVSKPWKIFISDPSFIKMHLKHSINNNNYEHLMLDGSSLYSIAAAAGNDHSNSSLADEVVEINDYPFQTYPKFSYYKVEILGSCNGLLLTHSSTNNDYFILNPSTKEFKKLPKGLLITVSKPGYYCRLIDYGFGYDEITEDYKVVRIMLFDVKDNNEKEYDASVVYSKVDVYSLRSNSWRKIQEEPPYNLLAKGGQFAGRLVNGALHWVAENNTNINSSNSSEEKYTIVSFNLGDEKYRVIEQPNYALFHWDHYLHMRRLKKKIEFHMSLNVLGGCLCIVRDFYKICSEIWVMKDYGVKESWTKLFTISQPSVIQPFSYVRRLGGFQNQKTKNDVRPIKFTKNGEVIFEKDKNSLFVYDPKRGTVKTLQIRGLKGTFETYTYVESLISLNSGTFVGQEHLTLEQTQALETKMYNKEMDARRRVIGR